MIAAGANVNHENRNFNANSYNPLMMAVNQEQPAAKRKSKEIVAILIERGMNINEMNMYSNTALS